MLAAIEFAHGICKDVIALQRELYAQADINKDAFEALKATAFSTS